MQTQFSFHTQLYKKLEILSDAAKYDVSCASSGSDRSTPEGGFGSSHRSGICHSWSADGRCISLLKILLTNVCQYDCAYCINRVSNDVPRASFTPREVADLTVGFYRRNYIEGLFLSSGVIKSPAFTMGRMIEVLKILRYEYRFGGYIHVKMIPDIDRETIAVVSGLADRVSTNIELPSERSLKLLAPQKSRQSVFLPLLEAKKMRDNLPVESKKNRPTLSMSTQMIIGATPESDYEILHLAQNLYEKALLKRVYYSAYIPINSGKNLPSVHTQPPLLREHRLYQADWLLRFYGFDHHELVDPIHPNLDINFDPKAGWALRHLELFPVDINRVEKEILLRIPGIGIRSAHKILKARRFQHLDEQDLKKLGISLKRARYFIHTKGKYLGNVRFNEDSIAQRLQLKQEKRHFQPGLFDTRYDPPDVETALLPPSDHSAISGEL